ncbi:uncharacterized protein LOC141588167 [Silene latifolia]|uniref:uncharacterized protein LOC141588167 n=1 Tax=Silene latifolia TaxID=37657 RepID=UPI003D7837EB
MAKKRSKSSLPKSKLKSKAKLRLSFTNTENLRLDNLDEMEAPTDLVIPTENSSSPAGIPQSSDAKTTKQVSEIMGILVVDLGTVVEDVTDSDDHRSAAKDEERWTHVTGKRSPSPTPSVKDSLQITVEDVTPELEYWSTAKTRLGFARLMVEVQVGQEFPDRIYFKDEKGVDAVATPSSPPFGGPTFHDSSKLPTPVSPIIRIVRQEHHDSPLVGPNVTYLATTSPVKNPASSVSQCDEERSPNPVSDNGYSDQQITVEVQEINSHDIFWYTVVYGSNSETDRDRLWFQLKNLKDICSLPWAQGSFFTWNNKQDFSTRVFSRIDRCLINIGWMHLYPDSRAYFINEGTFDHCPCICYRRNVTMIRNAPFRYFNMWSLDPHFQTLVQHEWGKPITGVRMYQVVTKLKNLKQPLKELNKNRFSDIEKSTDLAKIQLDNIQTQMHQNSHDSALLQAEKEVAASYTLLNNAKISFLRQKTKTDWLKGGDDNTRFFHSQIKARQIHNNVLQITDSGGNTYYEHTDIEQAFLSYYQGLLGTSTQTTKVHKPTVRTGKSPGPDRFSSQLFKDTWDTVGPNVCAAVKDVFHSGKILRQINTTAITLIPKVPHPKIVMEFRPIACCNIIYKCIAKLLCNRLSEVLPDIVSENQGGFVKGRSIVENILTCQDIVRLYNRKSASPRCLVKIDLKKAYDSVEWEFLHQMLKALKFPDNFGFFPGKRGLGQGDPLSPLMFTLCMEYLSRILTVVGQQSDFRFHPLCSHLKLNHLLFADDLLLFLKGNALSIMWILRAFATFSAASGLQLNKEKSEIYFNGVHHNTQHDILQISGFVKGSLPFKYLGVPISSKKLTSNEGRKLIDKIVARIRAWGAKHLSYTGRLTLVTSVLQSLHSYWSNIFLIPNCIMNKIDAICRNFLWGDTDLYLRAPAIHWDHCCRPKTKGGLGIKATKFWNKAILGNWTWKKLTHLMGTFRPAYVNDNWNGTTKDYSVQEGYRWLRPSLPQVHWWRVCWNSMNIPKTSFIYWAMIQNRLFTRDRMNRIGCNQGLECYLCAGADETHLHLFFDCPFSTRCVYILQNYLGIHFDPKKLAHWYRCGRRLSKLVKKIVSSCYIMLVHSIWQARYRARLLDHVIHPEVLVKHVLRDVFIRFWAMNQQMVKSSDKLWLDKIKF